MSQNVEQQAPLRITISEVKNLLEQGKSRKEIAEYYGKSQAEMQRMVWSHPKLKNLKAKKQYTGIELMDDEEGVDDPIATANVESPQITDAVTQQSPTEVCESQEEVEVMAEEEVAPSSAPADQLWDN